MFNYAHFGALNNNRDAIKALEQFTIDVTALWDRMVNRITDLPDDILQTVKNAWQDIKDKIGSTTDSIDENSLLSRLRSPFDDEDSLIACGLWGNELKAKLSMIQYYFEEQLFGEDNLKLKKLASLCLTLLGSILAFLGIGDQIMEGIYEVFELVRTIFLD